jgi:hypothetical protein
VIILFEVTVFVHPALLVKVRETLYVPGVVKQTLGFCWEELAGFPPVNVQLQLAAEILQLLKLMHKGAQPAESLEATQATGNGFTTTVTVLEAKGVPQLSVTTTVKVVVVVGETVTEEPEPEGAHVYV